MLQAEKSLAKECITSKYIHEHSNLAFRKDSQVWKDIGRSFLFLMENVRWKVGDVKSVSVWYDNWLGIGAIRN